MYFCFFFFVYLSFYLVKFIGDLNLKVFCVKLSNKSYDDFISKYFYIFVKIVR